MAYMNVQTSNNNNNTKGQVSSIVSVSISFVIFCGIMFFHVWDRVLKPCLQQPITKVQKIFKKPTPSSSNDLQTALVNSRSPTGESKSTSISVVSVEMKRESILFDIDD